MPSRIKDSKLLAVEFVSSLLLSKLALITILTAQLHSTESNPPKGRVLSPAMSIQKGMMTSDDSGHGPSAALLAKLGTTAAMGARPPGA